VTTSRRHIFLTQTGRPYCYKTILTKFAITQSLMGPGHLGYFGGYPVPDTEQITTNYSGVHKAYGWLWLTDSTADYGDSVVAWDSRFTDCHLSGQTPPLPKQRAYVHMQARNSCLEHRSWTNTSPPLSRDKPVCNLQMLVILMPNKYTSSICHSTD